jgi:hypothetical protein
VPFLLTALGDPDARYGQLACDCFTRVASREDLPSPPPPELEPKLVEQVRTGHEATWHRASRWLTYIGPSVIPGLIETIDASRSPPYIWRLASTLADMGPEAKAALPALQRALERHDGYYRHRRNMMRYINAIKAKGASAE